MRILTKILVFIFSTGVQLLHAQDTIRIALDLTTVVDDRVKVIVYAPKTDAKTISYVMPAVIPGSYYRKDFGRFVNQFSAYNKKGKKLKVRREDKNVFTIKKANELDHIEYWMDDTWDAPDENFVFQPGGTNIQDKKNFVINHQGFYGYFEGYKLAPYHIEYTLPDAFYGCSHLPLINRGQRSVAVAPDYVRLVDNPILFCKPDTISFMSGNMHVHIGIYSENKVVKSSLVKDAVEPLAKALHQFFGKMPVNDYYFIMYFPKYSRTGVARYGGFGALEHSYCSFYFIPEIPDERELVNLIQSIAGHEFLHILTPLNMHSEEIAYFDFRNPKMSQHLWMYEGITEYFAHLVRLKNHLTEEADFIQEMTEKITNAASYPSVSFTTMSKEILKEPYKDMYINVYQKGALFGLLLDIRLQELSKGNMGLRELMLMLAAKYGPDRPFKDDSLIPEIVRMTFPEIKSFFTDYIQGNQPLPFKDYFEKIGWDYFENEEVEVISFGKLYFFADKQKNYIEVLGTEVAKNEFGLTAHDVLLEVNGDQVDPAHYDPVLLLEYPENTGEVKIKFRRGEEIIEKTAAAKLVTELKKFYIRKKKIITPEQSELRKRMFDL